MTPIPTFYNGTQFRSRLEARWAAFFDLAGWRWEYEPPEEGGWIPDFLLIGDKIVKVEVKPINWVGDERSLLKQTDIPELEKVRQYIKSQEQKHEDDEWGPTFKENVLVLGAYPYLLDEHYSWEFILGVFLLEGCCNPDLARLGGGYAPRKFDFCAVTGSYSYRIGGEYEGGHIPRECIPQEVDQAWREAGNRVQWCPPGEPRKIVKPDWVR